MAKLQQFFRYLTRRNMNDQRGNESGTSEDCLQKKENKCWRRAGNKQKKAIEARFPANNQGPT